MDLPAGSRQAEDGGNRLRGLVAGRECSRFRGTEWPWSYLFLAMVTFCVVLHAAGRSVGLDAWLRRGMATFCEQPTAVRYSGFSFAALMTSRRRS